MLVRICLLLIVAVGALAEPTVSPSDVLNEHSRCPTFRTTPELRRQATELEDQSCRAQADFASCCNFIVKESRLISGVYSVLGRETFCDDGWMLMQRSYAEPSERNPNSFSKSWDEYERGFGDPNKVFWLGLEALHNFTSLWSTAELRIDLFSSNGSTVHYAHYDRIVVEDKRSNYKIRVFGFSGTVPDYLSYHNGSSFTTKDRDNDRFHFFNCAQLFGAGWWYTPKCGPVYQYYYRFEQQYAIWGNYTVTGIEMKLRPKHWVCGTV